MKILSFALTLSLLLLSPGFGQEREIQPKKKPPQKVEQGPASEPIEAHPKLLRLEGRFDGSGRFSFTRKTLTYHHKHWGRPNTIFIDGEPWNNLAVTPAPWKDVAGKLDLGKAWIVKREGRDTVALEQRPDGFDLYVVDSPNGAAAYSIVIAIPRIP